MASAEKTTLGTPSISHLSNNDFEQVYDPAEDTFLLLDALESELAWISAMLQPSVCVEVGSGSGVVSVALASALKQSCYFVATDVNSVACGATRRTAEANGVEVNVLQADLLGGIYHRLRGHVDLFLCNPPYVATTDSEASSATGLSASWAGGAGGRNLTDRLLTLLPDLLSSRGAAYVVMEQCNGVDAIVREAPGRGLQAQELMRRRAGRELLYVVKFTSNKLKII